MSPLDPRDPLVLDLQRLARRPGQMVRITRQVPAPADLRIDVIGVPEGAPVELDLRAESVVEGVLVSGNLRAEAVGDCVRCLEPVSLPLALTMQELFAYPDTAAAQADDVPVLEDELVDLRPMMRDAVVLALPLQPLCRNDCRGLCPDCGVRLDDFPEHEHEQVDPRWDALRSISPDLQQDLQKEGQSRGSSEAENLPL